MISQKEFIAQAFPKMKIRHKILRRLFEYASRIKLLLLPPIRIKDSQSIRNFTFLMIFNKKNFIYTKATLYSFLKNSNDLPQNIILISDGSWELEEGKQYFSFLQGFNVTYESYQDSIEYFKSKQENELAQWAQKHIWGKKYASIVRHAAQDLVLFSDPDVLWYKSPFKDGDFASNEILKLSIDNSHNYDDKLIEILGIDTLYNETPINCGIVLMKGKSESFHCINGIKEALKYESKVAGPFAEQTIFAIEYLKYKEVWNETEISASISDMLQPYFRFNKYPSGFIARHYLFILKWIYWKDFLTKI